MVNARDSRFILVRTLNRDRVIALRPVGISLCVGLIVKCRVVQLFSSKKNSWSKELCPPLYSQEARVLVGLQCRVLVGLQGNIITRITWEESRSSLFLAGYPVGPVSTSPRALHGWALEASSYSFRSCRVGTSVVRVLSWVKPCSASWDLRLVNAFFEEKSTPSWV